MAHLSTDAVAHTGKILLGAGVRSVGLRPLSTKAPAPGTRTVEAPAAVVDTGKVRLGAGVRRG